MPLNDDYFISEPERDPLEINGDIFIKDEVFDSSIKQELVDVDIFNDESIPSISEPAFPGIPKIVNVKELLKKSKPRVTNFKADSGDLIEHTKPAEPIAFNLIKLKKFENTNPASNTTVKSKNVSQNNTVVSVKAVKNIAPQSSNLEKDKKCKSKVKPQTTVVDDKKLAAKKTNDPPISIKPSLQKRSVVKSNNELVASSNDQFFAEEPPTIAIRKTVPLSTIPIMKVPCLSTEGLHPFSNDKTKCNCMRYIELYCSKCDVSSYYRKDLTQCLKCKSLLKLQCCKCRKRYAYLSSFHQYLLQLTKRRNFLSDSKDVKFKCLKKKIYRCSKCNSNFFSKEKLDEHIQIRHKPMQKKSIPVPVTIIKKPCTFVSNFSASIDNCIKLPCKKCTKLIDMSQYFGIDKPSCKSCNEELMYECVSCYRPYVTLRNARKHVQECFAVLDMMACDHCTFKTKDKLMLAAHVHFYHMPECCLNCGEVFENSKKMTDHKVEAKCVPKNNKIEASKISAQKPPAAKKIKKIKKIENNCVDNKIEDNNKDEIIEIFSKINPVAGNDKANNDDEVFKNNLSNNDWDVFHKDHNYTIVDRNPTTLLQEISNDIKPKSETAKLDGQTIEYYCKMCDKQLPRMSWTPRPLCINCKNMLYYRCTLCKRAFNNIKTASNHAKCTCPNYDKLVCKLCPFNTQNRHILFTHIKTYHTIFRCLRCNCNYAGFRGLTKHIDHCKNSNAAAHSNDQIEKLITMYCTTCNKTINSETKQLTGRPICPKCTALACYQCLKCKNVYANYTYTFKHVKELCQPKYSCVYCKFKAYEAHELNVHVNSNHVSQTCNYCGKKFSNDESYKLHMRQEWKKLKIKADNETKGAT